MFCFSTCYVLVSLSHKNATEKDTTPILFPSKHFSQLGGETKRDISVKMQRMKTSLMCILLIFVSLFPHSLTNGCFLYIIYILLSQIFKPMRQRDTCFGKVIKLSIGFQMLKSSKRPQTSKKKKKRYDNEINLLIQDLLIRELETFILDCLMYNGAVKLCMMISFCMFGFENPKHNLLLLLCSYFRVVAAGKMTFFLSLLMYRQ